MFNAIARQAEVKVAYLAPPDLIDVLAEEVKDVVVIFDHLILASKIQHPLPLWTQNIWLDPVFIPIHSISHAAESLRSLQLRWTAYSYQFHRRTQLIQQQLPKYEVKPLQFLGKIPTKPLGSWLLINENLIFASAKCSSPFPNGEIFFNENKTDPPSRAYLKLWELFTVYQIKPNPNSLCLDLGSSPGGWTWVLQQIGCRVISVDKSPLAENIMKLPGIKYQSASAFSLSPEIIGPIDYLFADIICYPSRLYQLIQRWLQSGLCQNFVCTIKFQGKPDFSIINQFLSIKGSKIIHLFNNKHELTWILLKENT